MPMAKREVLTPAQAALWLEALPPVEIKNRLLDYLEWQAKHGKIILHGAHYFRLLHYGYRPREETMSKRTAGLRALIQQVGQS